MTKETVAYHCYRVVLGGVARLPFPCLYALSNVLYVLLRHVLRYRCKVVHDNLLHAFPEANEKQRTIWQKAFYRHLADVIVETIKLLHVTDEEMARHVTVQGAHLVDEAARRGHPVVAYLGHYGNWEWNTFVTRFYRRDIHTAHIYKPLHDRAFDRLMLRLRGRFDSEGIAQQAAVRRLLALHREGLFLVGVIGDHRPHLLPDTPRTTFLHQDTAINTGAEMIGRKCHAEFLYLDVEKRRRGRYVLTFKPIVPAPQDESAAHDAPLGAVTRAYYHLLEGTIRREPAYWLWTHKRWKH